MIDQQVGIDDKGGSGSHEDETYNFSESDNVGLEESDLKTFELKDDGGKGNDEFDYDPDIYNIDLDASDS